MTLEKTTYTKTADLWEMIIRSFTISFSLYLTPECHTGHLWIPQCCSYLSNIKIYFCFIYFFSTSSSFSACISVDIVMLFECHNTFGPHMLTNHLFIIREVWIEIIEWRVINDHFNRNSFRNWIAIFSLCEKLEILYMWYSLLLIEPINWISQYI